MMEGRFSFSGAMNEAILATLQQAYQDLDLFPLVKPEDIARFRVDYGREVLVRLKQEVNASSKTQKFLFAGHRGCGKSTLLKRFTVEMQPQHFAVFFSIADLIEPAAVTHRNILYAIALELLSAATQQRIPIAEDRYCPPHGASEWRRNARTGADCARMLHGMYGAIRTGTRSHRLKNQSGDPDDGVAESPQ